MKKKISILTFHGVPNYGAIMQAYGMQQYLKKHTGEVEIIDYRPDYLFKEYKYINTFSLYSVLYSLYSIPTYAIKRKKIDKFIFENMNLSSKLYKTNKELCDTDSDFLVLGSDQIWNPQITNGFDPAFFGEFNTVNHPVVISYAASLGKGSFSSDEKEELKRLVSGLDYVSVREEEAKNILGELTSKDIEVVCDPTILAGRECFDKFVKPVKHKKYLLFYSLNGYHEAEKLALETARKLGLTLIELSGGRKDIKRKKHKVIYTAGPSEFLSYIKNADFVVTDSFHGTVFSLLYHTDFITFPHKTRNGRISGLLEKCGLSGRIMSEVYEKALDKIDWDAVEKKLFDLRQQSENFIKKAIDYKR